MKEGQEKGGKKVETKREYERVSCRVQSAGPSPQRELSYSCCSPVLREMWLTVLGTLGDMGHFPEFLPRSGN